MLQNSDIFKVIKTQLCLIIRRIGMAKKVAVQTEVRVQQQLQQKQLPLILSPL